ncbi:MAG TPA: NAD-dependent epimerase/dehydratase family protein [Vicinamibacterales bacterium]|jgi:UDP-glucose 4-epimerase
MRALVLGGSGFIGSHLVDALLADGHRVRVFDRQPDRLRGALKGVDYRFGSLVDVAEVAEALVGIDVVYHLVSTSVPSTSNLDPLADIQGNLVPAVQLLDQMVRFDVRRIVFLSSGGTVYGNTTASPVRETHPLRPICSYGVVKVAIENYLLMYQELYAIEPVVLRPSNPVGPRQGHIGVQGVVPTFLRRLLDGDQIHVWGDGTVVRDYIDITDLVSLCVRAGSSDAIGVFNAGSGVGTSILEVLSTIELVTGVPPNVTFQPSRAFDVQRIVLDSELARRTFDWSPSVTLEESIRRVWSWLLTLNA